MDLFSLLCRTLSTPQVPLLCVSHVVIGVSMYSIFGNSTDAVSWADNPHRRGTQEILTSCTITIFLCVWTAVHLNLPLRTEAEQRWYAKRQLWRKIGWLILTLLAPDMAIYTAWSQRREAIRLKNLRIKAEKRGYGGEAHSGEWGMKHAFYAIMGGFVIDIESEASFLPSQRKSMTLTAKGIQYVAEHFTTLLPDVSEEEIADKSKAGALAKSFVCIQAGWFIAQCVSRMVLAYPITLLEVRHSERTTCQVLICIVEHARAFCMRNWHLPTLVAQAFRYRATCFN